MKTVGALLFPGFELLDLFGPMEMFGLLPELFDLHLVAEERGPVASRQKLEAVAEYALTDRNDFDILFVPGGLGVREYQFNQPVLDWIKSAAGNAEYVLSVCSGSVMLARAGLLEGRKATSNKMSWSWVKEQAPDIDWVAQARWVEDGKYFTSSGVSAGMDMTLAVIAKTDGIDVAREVAMMGEYEWHEDADRDPFAKIHGLV